MTYPLGLQLAGKKVLVVGGGELAARRIRGLLREEAEVLVIAPEVVAEIRSRAAAGELSWQARPVQEQDLDEAWLVLAHTDAPEVQDRIAEWARQRRIFCVKGGDAARSDAWVPARAEAHGVQVAVSAGGDPRRAKAVAQWAAAGLESGIAPIRAHRETAPEASPATEHAPEAGPPQEPGTVALVGGGPGDPGLLTVRGRYLLAAADVVVADRLGPTGLLPRLAETARIIDVGKRAGYHKYTQDRINQTLVEEAQRGLRVVRLKGGDPYVFGRGGEEAEFCRAHGIRTQTVPGITSAVSVPAAAGIPVTHRDLSHGFSVVTAHQDLPVVPHAREHTLLLLMGVRRLPETARTLVELGHDPQTPVAVVERGWTPAQRTTVGTLETIGELAARRGVKAPAVVVVGNVAALGQTDPD